MASQGKISNSSRMALSPRQIDWFLHKESNIKKSRKGVRSGVGLVYIKREGTTEFQSLQSLSQEDPLQ